MGIGVFGCIKIIIATNLYFSRVTRRATSVMALSIHIALLIVACFACATGLRCWKCGNARSPGQCIEFGRTQICKKSQKVCQTELRFSSGWGSKPTIRTGCKEEHACGNNFVQNPRKAWLPSQCNKGVANSVCRCCCKTNNCNENELLCEKMFENNSGPPRPPLCVGVPKAPLNGTVICRKSRYEGSSCRYMCNRGHVLVGNAHALCRGFGDFAMWTGALPYCRRLPICDPIAAPERGTVKCFGGNKVGTLCKFTCDRNHKIEGPSAVSCIATPSGPRWTEAAPMCTLTACEDFGEIKHGNVNCSTDNNIIGTTCSFDCGNTELFLTPAGTDSSRCIWKEGEAVWTRQKPCCSGVVCPPTAKKDIVIALDSSGSISSEEWVLMKKFVIRVLGQFIISPTNIQISMFRFNREIDTDSQIVFGDHDSLEGLTKAIENMPKNGGGTYIGRALRYARNYMFRQNNRPGVGDMLWILTDGRSNDEFKASAKQLRDDGVDIIVLGISKKNDPRFMQQLLDLTGDEKLIMEVKDVVNSFEEDLVQLAMTKICEIYCMG